MLSFNKFLALFAVALMVACPLAAFASTASDTALNEESKDSKNATHIKLTGLDKDSLKDLFASSESNGNETTSSLISLLSSLLMPGFNVFGTENFNLSKMKIEGVDIEFDYLRDVKYGENSNTMIAVDINVNSMSLSYDKSYEGMNMLVSDALAAGTVPKSYFDPHYATKLNDIKDVDEKVFEELKRDLKSLCAKSGIEYPITWPEDIKKAKEVYADTYVKALYFANLVTLNNFQTLFATGDYGVGIREAFAGKTFNGESFTISGNAHVALYLKSDIVTQKVDVGQQVEEIGNLEGYVITESGVTMNMIKELLDFIPSGKKIKPTSDVNAEDEKEIIEIISSLFNVCPLSEFDLLLEGRLKVSHADSDFTYETKLKLEEKSLIKITYDDPNTVLKRKWDNNKFVFTNTNTFYIEVKECKMAMYYESAFDGGNGRHSKNINSDFSDSLKNMCDKMFGLLTIKDKRDSYTNIEELETDSWLYYENWFGFIFNTSLDPEIEQFLFTWFDGFQFKFRYFLFDFDMPEMNDNSDDPKDDAAQKKILDKGGEAVYNDFDTTNKGLEKTQSYFNSSTSDNTVLIVGVIVAIIVIVALIAFAIWYTRCRI